MHINQVRLCPEEYPTDKYYPFNLGMFRQTRSIRFDAPVTFFAGENGSGKSTLLEAISLRCGIHIWYPEERTRFQYNPYERLLHRYIKVEWTNGHVPGSFFAAEIFKNFAQNLDEWAATNPGQLKYFGGKSLLQQSHGQALLSFFRSRYRIKGIYLLDEPETALSPKSQIELLQILAEMGQAGHAQFIVATHSPLLLACPGAVIYSFDQTPIKSVDYKDTDYYRLYKDFLDCPERYVSK